MDNMDTNNPEVQTTPPDETELSHSDKMIGVFTEPAATFAKASRFPIRTIDWFLPFLILMVLVAVTQIIVMSNPEIFYQAKEERVAQMRQTFDEMVKKGQMTQEQADEQMNKIDERFAQSRSVTGYIIQTVSILIVGFIFFFIVTGIYFLFAKFIFKDEGAFNSALLANGLTAYITAVEVVLAAILSLMIGRLINDVSVASLINADKFSFVGFILGKLDIITIWAFIVVSIGLSKMFKSKSAGKYYGMVFGLWIGWSLLIFFAAKAVPFLKFLVR
jgi:hypothetical protein